MNYPTHTLLGYVIAVLVVWAVIIGVAHWTGTKKERDIIRYGIGFLLGMLAMYIAVNVYGLTY